MMENVLQKISQLRKLLPNRRIWSIRLSQHIGAPANPIVAVGDHVLKGQKIAEAGGFVSCTDLCICVRNSERQLNHHFNPTGTKVNCIVVENDGEYEEAEHLPAKPLERTVKRGNPGENRRSRNRRNGRRRFPDDV